ALVSPSLAERLLNLTDEVVVVRDVTENLTGHGGVYFTTGRHGNGCLGEIALGLLCTAARVGLIRCPRAFHQRLHSAEDVSGYLERGDADEELRLRRSRHAIHQLRRFERFLPVAACFRRLRLLDRRAHRREHRWRDLRTI